jgi:type I restriction enzyme S subunit
MTESAALLSDLCDLISLQVDPATMPESPYLGLEHLEPGRLRAIGFGKASDATSQKAAFEPGDVLYGKLRPYLDKAVLADRAGVATTELLVLRPKLGVSPEYLACVVHSPAFVEFAMQGVTGAQHPRTSWTHIRAFELPAHDRSEQASIAKLLWSLFGLCMAAGRGATSASSLKRAAMEQLFTRGLRGEKLKETESGPIPESWSIAEFGEVREFLQYGTSVHCTSDPGGYPVLRIPNIEPGRVNSAELKYCDLAPAQASKYLLQHGDLLFIRTNGVIDRLGSCAVYEGDPGLALFASYLIRARLTKRVLPKFAAYFYGSPRGTFLVAGRATPASDGKYNLNTGTIDALPLPMPPTAEEQQEIVDVLDALDRKIDLYRRKRDVLDRIFKSLLYKLMTGAVSVDDLDLSALPSIDGSAA